MADPKVFGTITPMVHLLNVKLVVDAPRHWTPEQVGTGHDLAFSLLSVFENAVKLHLGTDVRVIGTVEEL